MEDCLRPGSQGGISPQGSAAQQGYPEALQQAQFIERRRGNTLGLRGK